MSLLALVTLTNAALSLTSHHADSARPSECATLSSNRRIDEVLDVPELAAKAVLPADASRLPGRARFVPWVRDYTEAQRMGMAALQQLRAQGGIWSLGNATDAGYGAGVAYGSFVNFKVHILHAYEVQMELGDSLWSPGKTLLDVGAGPGWIDAYLMAKYGTTVVAYEVPFTSECRHFLSSPFRVSFFWGTLYERERSFDAVSFMSVLHHAANHTPLLLRQAAKIARRYILINEDTLTGSRHVASNLRQHDPNGVFRSDAQWRELFRQHCEGFEVVRSGPLLNKYPDKRLVPTLVGSVARAGQSASSSAGGRLYTGVHKEKPFANGYRFYVLERR